VGFAIPPKYPYQFVIDHSCGFDTQQGMKKGLANRPSLKFIFFSRFVVINFIERVKRNDNEVLFNAVVALTSITNAANFDIKIFNAMDKVCQLIYNKYKATVYLFLLNQQGKTTLLLLLK